MKINTFLLISISLIFLYSCKGPAGEAGGIGPQGATGDKGAKGDVEKFNVISSEWYAFKTADFIKAYDAKTFTSKVTLSGNKLNQLTDNIMKDGMILVYNRISDDPSMVYALPFTLERYNTESGLLQTSYYFEAKPKQVDCLIKFSKNPILEEQFLDEEFRVVIVPGPSGARLKNLDLRDYAAVKKAFNLTD